jgi:hypothetical protein
MNIGEERYHNKRNLGYPKTRRDGSMYNPKDDNMGMGWEEYVCRWFGCHVDTNLYRGGDKGIDLVKNGVIIGCYCAGIRQRKDGSPSRLIKNTYDKIPHIHVVGVRCDTGYEIVGWITHKGLIDRPLEPFTHNGKTTYKHTCPINLLEPMDKLDEILHEENPLDIIKMWDD